jgi:hypothetical protein
MQHQKQMQDQNRPPAITGNHCASDAGSALAFA